jgi:hypothetical protein
MNFGVFRFKLFGFVQILVNGLHLNPKEIADGETGAKGIEKWTQHPPKMASIQEVFTKLVYSFPLAELDTFYCQSNA